MPRIRHNGGIGQITPREGVITHVEPEVQLGGRGTMIPAGTREHAHEPARPEPIRNGMPFTAYDESRDARARRAASPQYRHARLALQRAQEQFGPRPSTIRGLPEAEKLRSNRRKPPAGTQEASAA